ncbi:hypothetical protein DSO57_1005412 [Entomophthora muscae]|uniref:Uncharacterized protein n=1 Tax=Entomophthora muscae TaxID=34485 RepID=A0ACC2TVI3_9FUNG|nr:hypothetical protein DSO57_1005412 [Entomophthora muscae]
MDSTFFSNAAENGRMRATYQIFEYTKTFRACAFAARSNLLYCHFLILSTRSEIMDCSIASWAVSHDVNHMLRCLNGRFGSMEVIPSGGGKSAFDPFWYSSIRFEKVSTYSQLVIPQTLSSAKADDFRGSWPRNKFAPKLNRNEDIGSP